MPEVGHGSFRYFPLWSEQWRYASHQSLLRYYRERRVVKSCSVRLKTELLRGGKKYILGLVLRTDSWPGKTKGSVCAMKDRFTYWMDNDQKQTQRKLERQPSCSPSCSPPLSSTIFFTLWLHFFFPQARGKPFPVLTLEHTLPSGPHRAHSRLVCGKLLVLAGTFMYSFNSEDNKF